MRVLTEYFLMLLIMNIEYSKVTNCQLMARKKKNSMTAKIVGGTPVTIEEFPFMVQLFNQARFCAGTIVNSWTVLTAAHCFDSNLNPEFVHIQAGSRYINDIKAKKYYADSIVVHKKYDLTRHFACDIALIFVKKPFQFTRSIQKGILAHNVKWMDPQETKFIATGWGWTKYPRGQLSKKKGLMMINMRFISYAECGRMYSDTLTDDMFCLYREGRRDVCRGDSGGGVILNGIIVGITSHGSKTCALKGKPTFYTNVFFFRRWIKHQIGIFLQNYCTIPGH